MSDEVIAEQPAPEQDATAAPEPVVNAPEAAEASEGDVKETPKVFSQEDLDAAIGKRLAREQRKWEREARQAEAPKPIPVEHVKPEQFTKLSSSNSLRNSNKNCWGTITTRKKMRGVNTRTLNRSRTTPSYRSPM